LIIDEVSTTETLIDNCKANLPCELTAFIQCTFRELVLNSVKQLKVSTIKMESFIFKAADIHEYHRQLKI